MSGKTKRVSTCPAPSGHYTLTKLLTNVSPGITDGNIHI